MGIIEIRQSNRRMKIDWIKRQIIENESISKKELVLITMVELRVSKRTATEYVEVARKEYG